MANKRQQAREEKQIAKANRQELLPRVEPDQRYILATQDEQAKLDSCSDQVSLASSLRLVRYLIRSEMLKDQFAQVPELQRVEERLVRAQLAIACQSDFNPSIDRLASQARQYLEWTGEALTANDIDDAEPIEAIKHYFAVVLDRRIIASLNQRQAGESIALPQCSQVYNVEDQAAYDACSESLSTSANLKVTRYQIQRFGLDGKNIPLLISLLKHEVSLVTTQFSIAKRIGAVTTQDTAAKVNNWLAVIIGSVLRTVLKDRDVLESVFDNITARARKENKLADSPIDDTMLPILEMEFGSCDEELRRILAEPAKLENK
jgi:hypothetical protein